MRSYFNAVRRRFSSKKYLPLLGILLLLAAFAAFFLLSRDENGSFEKQAAVIFHEEMLSNTLNMHYKLANPQTFGISNYEAVLPCYSAAGRQEAVGSLKKYIDELLSVSPDSLSEENRYTYTLLLRYLQNNLSGCAYTYYDEPLSPSSGMQSQLPILLAEYTFRTKRDVEDYLALLDQTDEYFAALAVYEKEKKEAGLMQADSSLQKVIEQCSSILQAKELAAGEHFLQTTFAERLELLTAAGIVTAKEAEKYISTNDRLLTTVMQPAYEQLADSLFLLIGDGTSLPEGLASLPEGKEYYEYLVRTNTGSGLSVSEIKDILYPHFEEEYAALYNLLRSREDAIDIWNLVMNNTPFPFARASDIIEDLKLRMEKDFPAFPDSAQPQLTVKEVSKSLQDYCAPAFYLTPPLDDPGSNVIYINKKSTPDGLELYTTLAHEGYPGHLYQSVYSQLYMQQENTLPVRQILWYGGYLEGWALYVEFMSYDYAAGMAEEMNHADAAFAYELEKHNRNMQLCLYSLLDIAIHYDNASYEQVHEVLDAFGISEPRTTRIVYDYVAEEPANYLKYYWGYMEILRLKEQARTLWGEEYTDMKFHRFFLEAGPSDFTALSELLKATAASSAHP